MATAVGDLPGILRRLDHIASLGVDCIWLSPITQSPQEDMGYDVSNYTAVDPLFGTMEDFDSLIERAHALGLKVIMDQVVSHTSDQHPWFRESRLSRDNARADWYVWADPLPDGSPPNNWPAVFGGRAWEWNPTRGQYYLHNFLASQPDLNFHNAEVQDAVLDIMRFWLERGVDGFRLDTVNYYFHDKKLRSNPPNKRDEHLPYAVNPYDMQEHKYSKSQPENVAFLQRVRALLDQFPRHHLSGRSRRQPPRRSSSWPNTHRAATSSICAIPSNSSAPNSPPNTSAPGSKISIGKARMAGPAGAFPNHDVPRHITRWAPFSLDPAALGRQSATLLLSLKGSVCLYQGEELGPARNRSHLRGTD
jgi:alpha-glucosidase